MLPMSNDLAEQLRDAIRASGLSTRDLARRSGVAQPVLSRFLSGQRDLTLRSASKVAAVFGMRWTKPKRPRA